MKTIYDLKGKIALVTGASGGLGETFAHALADSGAQVLVTARREDAITQVAKDITDKGGIAHPVVMDVMDQDSVAGAFDAAIELAGVPDVVVCNAGVAVTCPAIKLTKNDWDKVIGTNLTGCWHVNQEAARRLIEHDKAGSIINISSILGQRGAGAVLPYSVAKAGLDQMTRNLALEWARYSIRVNALSPGYIETPLNKDFFATDAGQAMIRRVPMRRLGQASELHASLLLMASDDSSFMTGHTMVVDGGHLQSSL